MISKKMNKALNDQIAMEGAASQKYLALASWCANNGMDGGNLFFVNHSDEERMHMTKIINYLWEVDGKAEIPAIEKPKHDYKNITEVIEAAYASEQAVTQSIYKLVGMALEEGDYQTHNFLQWYVSEQLEEEALMRKVLDKLKLIGSGDGHLYFIDEALSAITAEEAEEEEENT